jgi:hypothetical protein
MEATQSRKNKGGQYSYPWVGIVMRQIAPYIQTPPTSAPGTSATYAVVSGTSADTSGADIMARRMAPMIYEYTP